MRKGQSVSLRVGVVREGNNKGPGVLLREQGNSTGEQHCIPCKWKTGVVGTGCLSL